MKLKLKQKELYYSGHYSFSGYYVRVSETGRRIKQPVVKDIDHPRTKEQGVWYYASPDGEASHEIENKEIINELNKQLQESIK